MSATEGRRRIPILDPERERRAAKPGDVVTYTLSPEEIEARYGKKGAPEKTPVGVNMEKRAQEKRAEREAAKKETSDMPRELPISKERYLEMRLEGMSRADISREIGLKYASDIYPMLARIGLRDTVVEAKEMKKLAQQKAEARNAEPADVKAVSSPAAQDVSHAIMTDYLTNDMGDAKSTPDYTSAEARNDVDPSSDALDLSSFRWVSPQYNAGREGVYLTKHDLRISGATAKPFEGAQFAQIGIKPEMFIVKPAGSGWKVRRNNKASGIYIGGRLLLGALQGALFSDRTTIKAEWNSQQGVLVCRLVTRNTEGALGND